MNKPIVMLCTLLVLSISENGFAGGLEQRPEPSRVVAPRCEQYRHEGSYLVWNQAALMCQILRSDGALANIVFDPEGVVAPETWMFVPYEASSSRPRSHWLLEAARYLIGRTSYETQLKELGDKDSGRLEMRIPLPDGSLVRAAIHVVPGGMVIEAIALSEIVDVGSTE